MEAENKSTSKDVLEYVGSKVLTVLWGIISSLVIMCIILFIACGLGMSLIDSKKKILGIIVFVVGGILIVLMLWAMVSTIIRLVREIKYNRTVAREEETVRDFDSAAQFFDDRLRLGKKYIFGISSGRIIPYTDVERIYQTVKKTSYISEQKRTFDCELLKDVDSTYNTYTLCRLQIYGKSDKEAAKAAALIASINPQIKFGSGNTVEQATAMAAADLVRKHNAAKKGEEEK